MLEVRSIYKKYKDQEVLKDINFTIEQGSVFGLIGPNGAGKSTLIKIITGLLDADSGDVLFRGKTLKEAPRSIKSRFGLVPQEIALIEEINAIENLHYFGSLYNMSGTQLKTRIEELLVLTGLESHRKQKVSKYSGGMKRRLNMAVALLHKPELLILDEPTVGVDPQSRNHIFAELQRLNREEGTTILYTSHYMEEVEALCRKIFILDEGQEIAFGTKTELQNLFGAREQLILDLSDSHEVLEPIQSLQGVEQLVKEADHLKLTVIPRQFKLASLLHLLEEHGVELKRMENQGASLEDLFLNLTGKSLRD